RFGGEQTWRRADLAASRFGGERRLTGHALATRTRRAPCGTGAIYIVTNITYTRCGRAIATPVRCAWRCASHAMMGSSHAREQARLLESTRGGPCPRPLCQIFFWCCCCCW